MDLIPLSCGAHRVAILILATLLMTGCDTNPQSQPTSPASAATPVSGALPTPTDYQSVCDLEASVCSCVGIYKSSYCGQSLPAALFRPLSLPTLHEGQPCPTTQGHYVATHDFAGVALGTGPVEPLMSPVSGFRLDRSTGWYLSKTLWFSAPSYPGPALVRGARIDGNGPVGFGEQPLIGHLVIPPGPTVNEGPDGYRQAPGGTFVRSLGCYAWQVDGLDFSYAIVFEAAAGTS